MKINSLTAISPIDGRYEAQTKELRNFFSEFGLMKYRVRVEIEWFIHLSNQRTIPQLPRLSNNMKKNISNLYTKFSYKDARRIKLIEKETNHDVKAVEYFIKEKIKAIKSLAKVKEFIHFGCTSEDINNLAYGLIIKEASQAILLKEVDKFSIKLRKKAHQYASIPMISRTHGQNATPTTVGKELANFLVRVERIREVILDTHIRGKINGAVGNYNAHLIAFPKANWENISKTFVTKLGLSWSPYTTQVEPRDALAKLMHSYERINNVFIDFSRDMCGYISLRYFFQKQKKDEIGSSTMPHKVNPIDFENAEGNFLLAISLLEFLSRKLPVSRLQRDLTDSTVLRNVGVPLGHILIALKSIHGKPAITPDCC